MKRSLSPALAKIRDAAKARRKARDEADLEREVIRQLEEAEQARLDALHATQEACKQLKEAFYVPDVFARRGVKTAYRGPVGLS